MKDLSKRAKEIIARIEYITLATVDETGQPWNSPVYSAYDQDYNFYWGSDKNSQHSKNIHANNKVFLVIYDSTIEAGKGEGVYVKAVVTELVEPDEVAMAHKFVQDRRPTWYWKLEQFSGKTPLQMFKAVPMQIWMNDDGEKDGHYIDIRTEVKL